MSAAAMGKPYRGMAMEGMIASWYARSTGKNLAEFRALGKRLAAELTPGAAVLEVAPGPGYLAVEIAQLGRYAVTGLDISHAFTRIASDNAERAGVAIDFRQGDAARMPFAAESFDFIVCRAAFKNFTDPAGALGEMQLSPFGAFVTRIILGHLRKRAYRREDFERMAAASPFGRCEILAQPLGFEVRLAKRG